MNDALLRLLPQSASTVLRQGKALSAALAPHPHPGSSYTNLSKKGGPKHSLIPHSLGLILYWNETSVSGSRCIGMKSSFQAHSSIGKCCYYRYFPILDTFSGCSMSIDQSKQNISSIAVFG